MSLPETIEFQPVTIEPPIYSVSTWGLVEPFEMPKPANLTAVIADGEPTGIALEAIVWRRLMRRDGRALLLRGWSLVPVGLPP